MGRKPDNTPTYVVRIPTLREHKYAVVVYYGAPYVYPMDSKELAIEEWEGYVGKD